MAVVVVIAQLLMWLTPVANEAVDDDIVAADVIGAFGAMLLLPPFDPVDITVAGVDGVIAFETALLNTLYDDDEDSPVEFVHCCCC